MANWKPIVPVPIDPIGLPEVWQLVHREETDDYIVLGRAGPDQSPSIVIRLLYASGADHSDLRHAVASVVTVGMARVVRRRRRRRLRMLER